MVLQHGLAHFAIEQRVGLCVTFSARWVMSLIRSKLNHARLAQRDTIFASLFVSSSAATLLSVQNCCLSVLDVVVLFLGGQVCSQNLDADIQARETH